jgi:hypothetical protein
MENSKPDQRNLSFKDDVQGGYCIFQRQDDVCEQESQLMAQKGQIRFGETRITGRISRRNNIFMVGQKAIGERASSPAI